MKRPSYLADEVPKMAAELVRLRARVAELERLSGSLCDYLVRGHPGFRHVDRYVDPLRAALAPRSERREGEPCGLCNGKGMYSVGGADGRNRTWACDECAPPAAPKEEE